MSVEELKKQDVLCVSENAYQSFSDLDKDSGTSLFEMMADPNFWTDD